MHRILPLVALLSVPLSPASSQIMRRVESEPAAWTSLGVGLLDLSTIRDKASNAEWSFGQGLQYRATLEKSVGGQAGLGLVVTFAQVPLTYLPEVFLPATTPADYGSCISGCDATANIWSVSGGFHMGGGMGLHQVIQFNAGATMFGNFRDDETGDQLPPRQIDTDLSFQIGYGVGYTISPRMQVSLLQEYGFIVHPGNGEGGDSRTAQTQATRLSVRYGIGTKAPAQPGIRRR